MVIVNYYNIHCSRRAAAAAAADVAGQPRRYDLSISNDTVSKENDPYVQRDRVFGRNVAAATQPRDPPLPKC